MNKLSPTRLVEIRANDLEILEKEAARYRLLRRLNMRNPLYADDYTHPVVTISFPVVPKHLNGYIWEGPQGKELDKQLDKYLSRTDG